MLNVHNQSAHMVRTRAQEIGLVNVEWIPDAKGLSEASSGTAEAGSESDPEGGRFERLRDILLKESVEGEDEDMAESGRVGQPLGNHFLGLLDNLYIAGSNDSLTEATEQFSGHDVGGDEDLARQESGQRSEHDASMDDNQESGQPSTKARKIWEWSRYDADAEHSLYMRTEVMAEPPRGMLTPPTDIGSAWEWTRYDSDAEREEILQVSASGRGYDGSEQVSS